MSSLEHGHLFRGEKTPRLFDASELVTETDVERVEDLRQSGLKTKLRGGALGIAGSAVSGYFASAGASLPSPAIA